MADGRRGTLEPRHEPAPEPRDADRDAIDRVLAGDPSAFTEIVQRHESPLRRVVTGMVADRHVVEDVLQEAFLAAYRGLPDFRGEAPFGAWLYRIVVREAVRTRSHWRRVWRTLAPLERAEEEVRSASKQPLADLSEDLDGVLQVLDRLRARERVALVLHVVEELSYEEVGQLLGCSSGTVGSLIHRARRKVQEAQGGLESERPAEIGQAGQPLPTMPGEGS